MLSKQEVQYIAHLSRIHLDNDETESLAKDLKAILEYINKLSKLNINNVEPTSHALAIKNVFRDDAVKPSLTQDDVMKFSVENHNGSFRVPQVIE